MRTVLKAIVVAICVVLLIWNATQLKAIEKGTVEIPVEYGKYVANDAVGEYREATILGLIPFAVEENQHKYNYAVLSSTVGSYYCLAILDDFSVGAVQIEAVNEELVGYDEWIVKTDEELTNIVFREGFTIRGKTVEMPEFDSNIMDAIQSGITDFDAMREETNEINDSVKGITLLDTRGNFADTEIQKPDIFTLSSGVKSGVILVLVIAALMLAWDLLKIHGEKANAKNKAQAQQEVPTANANGDSGVTLNAQNASNLAEEYKKVLLECSSVPPGNETQAAEYAVGKLYYFREKGLPEKELYYLEIAICTNIPSYVANYFGKYMAAVNNDVTPIWAAMENLIQQGRLEPAYQISKPLIDHLEKHRTVMLDGKRCFQSVIEECMYRIENHLTMESEIEVTRSNYVGVLVAYAKLLQQLSLTRPEFNNTSITYLEMAKELCSVNSSVYLYMAQHYDHQKDDVQWRLNMDRALMYCYNKDGLYGLAQIYYLMGLHYIAREEENLGVSCLTLCIRYADPQTAAVCRSLLSKTRAGMPLPLDEAVSNLRANNIQVGYGQPVKNIVYILASNPGTRPLIQHIVDDKL